MLCGEHRQFVIDRSFTNADGKRWIVDYKTSSHEGADKEGFLDRERASYRAQLERYAQMHRAIDIHLGLYFPLLMGGGNRGKNLNLTLFNYSTASVSNSRLITGQYSSPCPAAMAFSNSPSTSCPQRASRPTLLASSIA